MDALQLKVSAEVRNKVGKAAVVDPGLCIGCGVCVHKCPSGSLALVHKHDTTEPSETAREYMMHYLAARRV
jgi:formate hydrogenlyase subunit 6/NADH:ubiquinone oxidoreductase subunit I